MTKGEIIFLKNKANLNQSLLSGFKKFEFIIPSMKKTIEIKRDHALRFSPLINGKSDTVRNTIEKTIPKLLLDPILTSL